MIGCYYIRCPGQEEIRDSIHARLGRPSISLLLGDPMEPVNAEPLKEKRDCDFGKKSRESDRGKSDCFEVNMTCFRRHDVEIGKGLRSVLIWLSVGLMAIGFAHQFAMMIFTCEYGGWWYLRVVEYKRQSWYST